MYSCTRHVHTLTIGGRKYHVDGHVHPRLLTSLIKDCRHVQELLQVYESCRQSFNSIHVATFLL